MLLPPCWATYVYIQCTSCVRKFLDIFQLPQTVDFDGLSSVLLLAALLSAFTAATCLFCLATQWWRGGWSCMLQWWQSTTPAPMAVSQTMEINSHIFNIISCGLWEKSQHFSYIIMISEYYIVRPLKPQYRRCDMCDRCMLGKRPEQTRTEYSCIVYKGSNDSLTHLDMTWTWGNIIVLTVVQYPRNRAQ